MLAHIREHFALSNDSYGRSRMTMELREAGLDVGERRVGRLMKDNGIRPVRTRRHKVTTDSHHPSGIMTNLLDGDFLAESPHQKWAGDISSIWPAEGWLYLAVVIDLFSRCVIGWAAGDRMKKDLAIRALDMPVRLRDPVPGCIFHSDRGSQYGSHDFQKKLLAHGLLASMSGKGNCFDNAAVETFLKSLKAERLWRQNWPTRR
ncbi:IS3 family element, transposase orfB [Komagataeibacter xylinus E25]|nr:IS3 family element, transposase orfB [Komagataeibacter xylinus E25]